MAQQTSEPVRRRMPRKPNAVATIRRQNRRDNATANADKIAEDTDDGTQPTSRQRIARRPVEQIAERLKLAKRVRTDCNAIELVQSLSPIMKTNAGN